MRVENENRKEREVEKVSRDYENRKPGEKWVCSHCRNPVEPDTDLKYSICAIMRIWAHKWLNPYTPDPDDMTGEDLGWFMDDVI